MSADELAALGNRPLADRVADLLLEVRFAFEGILDCIEIERAAEPFAGFHESIVRLDAEIRELMERLGTNLSAAGRDTTSYPFRRDHEIEEVLTHITFELRRIDLLCGPERDAALAVLEAWAAPYALALFHEIGRVDEVLQRISAEPQ